MAKTKTLISCTVTTQLICAFVFAYAKSWFSHDMAQLVTVCSINAGTVFDPRWSTVAFFDCRLSAVHFTSLSTNLRMSRIMRKPAFCICENKGADQLRGSRVADQRLCFRYMYSTATCMVQSLFFLNPKFQASSHILWLHSPVFVGTGWRRVFSCCGLISRSETGTPVFSQGGSYHPHGVERN